MHIACTSQIRICSVLYCRIPDIVHLLDRVSECLVNILLQNAIRYVQHKDNVFECLLYILLKDIIHYVDRVSECPLYFITG